MSSEPFIAIAIPSGDMVHADFAANLAALCLNPGARAAVINCKSSIISIARNQCVGTAQLIKATHILFLDSDMVFPVDLIRRLLAHDKDIVGALYSRRRPPFTPTGMPLFPATHLNGLQGMINLPTGCLLLRTSIFERLAKPWFCDRTEGDNILGEDIHFCEKARAAGLEIWQDTALSREVGHIGQQTFRIT